ncbi:hypothetical protein SAMN03080598_02349 [Algoriphagus boritolerans DSM 17298 = JCM 18970]|uniref:Uncharacterized protein n=1 Tax=Algoriphagus boritolerans DSM 17298 = JCM 18970 TaxID=1120964 RepID=A0A1H5X5C9_9BACT|nr:hypothetical protein SAMN03080598_02349 [Algoriphagus boritolerans DSM 17298 = JCM 18970]
MGKPFRNIREGFFVFRPKIRIFWKSISENSKNQILNFSHFFVKKEQIFKPVFKFLT